MTEEPPEELDPIDVWEQNKHTLTWFQAMKEVAGLQALTLEQYIHENITRGAVPIADIESQYKNVSDEAGEAGETITILEASPVKRGLLGVASTTPIWSAYAEFIDNILDNYIQNIEALKEIRGQGNAGLEVRMALNSVSEESESPETNGTFLISENSGGVQRERWVPLIQSGSSDWSTEEGMSSIESTPVGTWGKGGMIALARLGRWNIFQSPHHSVAPQEGAECYAVQLQFGSKDPIDENSATTHNGKKLDKNYYSPDNDYWNREVSVAKQGFCMNRPGTSAITIKRLEKDFLETICNHNGPNDENSYAYVVTKLARVFEYKLNSIRSRYSETIEIVLHNSRLEETNQFRDYDIANQNQGTDASGIEQQQLRLFTFLPGVHPVRYRASIQLGGEQEKPLEMEVLVGMQLDHNTPTRGFMLWGNDRLFEEGFKGFDVSHGNYIGWGENGSNVQNGRVRGFVKLTSHDPSKIPWLGPIKWGFNHESKYGKVVIDILRSLITRYTRVSNVLGGGTGLTPQTEGPSPFLSLFSYEEGEE